MYEKMKAELVLKLRDNGLDKDTITIVSRCLDNTFAGRYDVTSQETALATQQDIGENFLVNLYLASQSQFWQSEGTEENYRFYLVGRYGLFTICRKSPAEIRGIDIVAYFIAADKQRQLDGQEIPSNRTKNKYLQTFSSFYNWAIKKRFLQTNPTEEIEKFPEDVKQRDYADRDELEILRSVCHTPAESALVEVLLITGARRAEITAITLGDIDWVNRRIDIQCGKGHKERWVAFNSRTGEALKHYFNRTKPFKGQDIRTMPKSTPLFCKSNGLPLQPNTLARRFTEIVKRAEISGKHITCHSMRHSCITLMLDEQIPIEQVAQYAGHANIQTTTVYNNTPKEKILNRMSNLTI